MKMYTLSKSLTMVLILFLLLPSAGSTASLDDVLRDASDGKLDNYSLIQAMLIATENSSGKAAQMKAKVDASIAQFVISGGTGKQVESILKSMKSKLLKQYWPGSSLESTMSEMKYDPLWGTALFVETLEKSKIPFQVIETPANYLITVQNSGSEVIYDVFAGKNPIKNSFEDYLSKGVGLRTSFQVKNFSFFRLNSAKRYNSSRIVVGAAQKRLINDVLTENFSDYLKTYASLQKNFKDIIIDQDKILETLSKKLKDFEDPQKVAQLIAVANKAATYSKYDTIVKELKDNSVLAARKTYLAILNAKDWGALEKYLKAIKPLVSKSVYTPMAKEGNLKIFNHHWTKKEYSKAAPYAKLLYKNYGIQKAKEFWVKSLLFQAQVLTKKKQYNQSIKLVNEVLKEDRKNADALKIQEFVYQTQYNTYKERNNYPEMVRILEKLMKLHPEKPDYRSALLKSYWTWAKTKIDSGDFQSGIKILTEGKRKLPESDELRSTLEAAYFNYAVTLVKKGKASDAIKILKKANDIFGDAASQQRNDFIGDLYLKLSIEAANKGERKAAMSLAEKGRIYAPDNKNILLQIDNLKRGKDSIEDQEIQYAPWD